VAEQPGGTRGYSHTLSPVFGQGDRTMTDSGVAGVGDPAPDFLLSTVEGDEVRLSHLRGRHVVVFFVREFT